MLSEKMDLYDKCFSSFGSDLSKVQSQVDLSMKSIQALQKEQVLLVQTMNHPRVGGFPASRESGGVMGASSTLGSHSESFPVVQSSQPHSGGNGSPALPNSPHVDVLHQSMPDSESWRQWMPKIDFPKFDGSDVRIWLDKCAIYFALYSIPHDFKVTAASLHMVDKASHWSQTYKHSPENHTWEHFVLAVSKEFDVNTHRVKTMELLNLRQSGYVEEYKNHFDQLVYHILLYDNNISETILVSQFLLGLKDDLRQAVEMHLPDSVSQTATLAAVQEHLNGRSKTYHKKQAPPKYENRSLFSPSELWKTRQLKEYRRANNLFFKCGEKYSPTHTYAPTAGALHMLEQTSAEVGEALSKEILEALEAPQHFMLQEECHLSLHAMSGRPQGKAIQLRALVQNKALVILVDSAPTPF
jgi:hypothetical protein